MQKSLVPELFFLPKDANQSPPLLNLLIMYYLRIMVGHKATVSTLVTVDGHPHSPALAGNGGFKRGLPDLPSKLSIRPYKF